MVRLTRKSVLFAVVVVALLLTTVDRADAWWWGCYRPAYYDCYSPCISVCDPCYSGGWYLGCRPGPVRRLLFGPYRWYYSGYWYGGCSTAYTTCCNEVPTCCGATGAVPATSTAPTPAKKPVIEAPTAPTPAVPEPGMTPAPVIPGESTPTTPGMMPTPTAPGEPNSTEVPIPETSGVVTVWVPFDAKVTINGLTTRSTGSRRQFVSYGLKPGFSYKYEIRAELVRNGQVQEDSRTVILTAGQNTAVAFGFNINPAEGLASAN